MSMTMDTSFSARRQAATHLPQFHLPAPGEIPSMAKPPSRSSSFSSAPSQLHSASLPQPLPLTLACSGGGGGGGGGGGNFSTTTSVLTPPLGVTSDGLSPLSSANTAASSQASAPSAGLSGYYGHSHGSWPTPGSGGSSYTFSSTNQQQVPPLGQSGYGGRGVYGQSGSISYGSRNPQSPPTGPEGPPAPSYDQGQQSYSTGMPGSAAAGGSGGSGGLGISSGTAGGGGSGSGSGSSLLGSLGSGPSGSGPSTIPSQSQHQQGQPPILTTQNPNSQPSSSTASGHGHGQVEAYPHSRTPPNQSYYAPVSSSHVSTFQSYTPSHQASHSHPHPSTSTGPARTLSSMVPPSGMAPPQPYRAYPYHQMSHVGGPIMSNMGNPGGQMSLVPGMGAHPYGQMTQRLYATPGHQTQQERPFKCDQCTQSFNRNHDLKRHKRIHLAVKPFPCPSCDKSFSRKDALKRHRLVRNCGEADKQDASKSTRRERNETTGRPQGNGPNMDLPVKMEGHHRDTVTRR